MNEGIAAELVFEGVGEGGIAVMRESIVDPGIGGTELQRLGNEIFGIGLKLIPSKCTVAMKIALDFHCVRLSGGGVKQGIRKVVERIDLLDDLLVFVIGPNE